MTAQKLEPSEINQPEDLDKEFVPVKTKVAFGLYGTAHTALGQIALGAAITFFYNIKLGLSEEWLSLAWLIFGIWNAVNDPLFGILEERTQSKIGRRIPYLRYGAPPELSRLVLKAERLTHRNEAARDNKHSQATDETTSEGAPLELISSS